MISHVSKHDNKVAVLITVWVIYSYSESIVKEKNTLETFVAQLLSSYYSSYSLHVSQVTFLEHFLEANIVQCTNLHHISEEIIASATLLPISSDQGRFDVGHGSHLYSYCSWHNNTVLLLEGDVGWLAGWHVRSFSKLIWYLPDHFWKVIFTPDIFGTLSRYTFFHSPYNVYMWLLYY